MFSGSLTGVVATCALELGIDVGHLDAVLILGFPGSISSMWQQLGRAGRSGRKSLGIVVCFDGPLDQYWVNFPRQLLDPLSFESAILDPTNSHVLNGKSATAISHVSLSLCKNLGHILCAGAELRLSFCTTEDCDCDSHWNDSSIFCSKTLLMGRLEALTSSRTMRDRGLAFFSPSCQRQIYETHSKLKKTYKDVSLRTIDPVSFKLLDESKAPPDNLMDTIPYSRAFFEVYPGSIYMHQSKTYIISRLDLDNYTAYAHRTNVQYYTSPRDHCEVNILQRFESKLLKKGSSKAHIGTVRVCRTIYGYSKVWFKNGRVFEKHEFSLPQLEFETGEFAYELFTTYFHSVLQSKQWLCGLMFRVQVEQYCKSPIWTGKQHFMD